jgi:hypothetical protein
VIRIILQAFAVVLLASVGIAVAVILGYGISVAAAIEREPPWPTIKPCCDPPLRLADTVVVPFEVLSDDARHRKEQQCRSEGGEPRVSLSCVHCDYGGPSRAGWTYGVSDVPKELRGVK